MVLRLLHGTRLLGLLNGLNPSLLTVLRLLGMAGPDLLTGLRLLGMARPDLLTRLRLAGMTGARLLTRLRLLAVSRVGRRGALNMLVHRSDPLLTSGSALSLHPRSLGPLHVLHLLALSAWSLRTLRVAGVPVLLLGGMGALPAAAWACRGRDRDREGRDTCSQIKPGHGNSPSERQERLVHPTVPLLAALKCILPH